MNGVTVSLFALAVVLTGFMGVSRGLAHYEFYVNVDSHIERAKSVNDASIAVTELNVAISELEREGKTSGNSAIFFHTPTDDVGFWYNNLKSNRDTLRNLSASPQTSELERSNTMLKVRESLNDAQANEPQNIVAFPSQVAFGFLWLLVVGLWVAGIVSAVADDGW